MDTRNDFERKRKQRVLSIDSLIPMPNYMIVKFNNNHEKTVGGIITSEGAKSFEYSKYSDRSGIVIKPPYQLTCEKGDESSMLWETDIMVQKGDEVFFDATEDLHSQKIICGDSEYSICRYDAAVLAKRGKEIVMLNGYVLLEPIYITKKALEFEKKEMVFNEGMVRYLGMPNKKYRVKGKNKNYRSDEGCPINIGDYVWLSDPQLVWFLEDFCFAIFDDRKMYRVCKRYMIGGIFETDEQISIKKWKTLENSELDTKLTKWN
jgi:co-chaperonin GroES (HSP10)